MNPMVTGLLVALFLPTQHPGRISITPVGKQLRAKLDSLHVEDHWQAGEHITNWKTGEADDKEGGPRTHCSLFVAAVCSELELPMLNPPPQTHLANRQQEWLLKEGKEKGWKRVKDVVKAQRLANQGVLVLASYKNGNPKKAGHIAVVRPAEVTVEEVQEKGPRITQAGARNYRETNVKTGFRYHKEAWANGEVIFFAYRPMERANLPWESSLNQH
jgi:hypothetical protein